MKKVLTRSALTFALLLGAGVFFSGCCSAPTCAQTTEAREPAITGTTWKLRLNTLSGYRKTMEKPERDITFRIEKSGMVSGCAGLNRYFGPAVLDPSKKMLKFGSGLGATKMAGRGMVCENTYLQMLPHVETYEIRGTVLRFLDKDGKELAIFDLSNEL